MVAEKSSAQPKGFSKKQKIDACSFGHFFGGNGSGRELFSIPSYTLTCICMGVCLHFVVHEHTDTQHRLTTSYIIN